MFFFLLRVSIVLCLDYNNILYTLVILVVLLVVVSVVVKLYNYMPSSAKQEWSATVYVIAFCIMKHEGAHKQMTLGTLSKCTVINKNNNIICIMYIYKTMSSRVDKRPRMT